MRGLDDEFGLPPQLAAMAKALRSLPNDRLRYQQLMALAGKLEPLPAELRAVENKVPGCLSTVHVHATLQGDGTVKFQGDSDALISKGLVALLVRGLSGCTPEEIARVKPEFIQSSGISASLTPGRNNGFFNMFKLMTKQARELALPAEGGAPGGAGEPADPEQTGPSAKDVTPARPVVQIYNTLTRQKEPLQTKRPGIVHMYVCGVTVYDLCHLGHARIMVFFDLVSQYLKQIGYDVVYVRNVTDIDDKIINRSAEAGEPAEVLARRMEEEMQKDCLALGCEAPTVEPRVSEHMPEILSMTESLVDKRHAYHGGRGEGGLDVYFRVSSFSTYGRLSGVKVEENQAGARVEVSSQKEAAEDFVLWKAAKPGEPSWESPWGPGRPGWHIECSAMAKKHLGDTLDIHGGGPDLIFPHHENEIAQSEAANGKQYATAWMHCAAVRSSGEEKMSKSLGNFVTIRDVLEKYDGESIRFYLLSSQYRQPLLYSEDALAKANERLLRLYSALRGVEVPEEEDDSVAESDALRRFHAALRNDFDTVSALGVMDAVSRELLQARQAGSPAAPLAQQLRAMGLALGVLGRPPEEVLRGGASVDDSFEARVEGLIAERAAARAAREFARADALRDELEGLGVVLEDNPQGTTWRVGAAVAS